MAFFLTGSWGSTVAPVCSRGGGGDVGCFPSSIIISAVTCAVCLSLALFRSSRWFSVNSWKTAQSTFCVSSRRIWTGLYCVFGVRSGYSAFVLRYFSSESACAECAQCSQVGPLCFEFGNNDISATSAAWKNAQCPACICQGHHIVTAAFLDTAFEALAIFMLGAAISCAQAGFSPGGELAVRTYEIYTALPSRSSRSKSGTVEQNAGLDVACPILNIMVNSLIACLLVFLASWGGFVFTNKTSDTSTLTFVSTLYYLAVVALSLMVLIIAAIALRYAMSADERQIQQSRKDNQGDANDMQQARRYLCLSLCAALVMEMMCQVAALLGHANCKDSKPMALLDVFMVFRLVAVMALFWCERNKHKRDMYAIVSDVVKLYERINTSA